MTQIILGHGVSGCFGTSSAPTEAAFHKDRWSGWWKPQANVESKKG